MLVEKNKESNTNACHVLFSNPHSFRCGLHLDFFKKGIIDLLHKNNKQCLHIVDTGWILRMTQDLLKVLPSVGTLNHTDLPDLCKCGSFYIISLNN